MELVALLVGSVALGVIRPRWSTLLAALVPTALAFAWLVMHEDIPGYPLGFADLAWYAGMSLVVGAAFALAIAAGIAAAPLGMRVAGKYHPRGRTPSQTPWCPGRGPGGGRARRRGRP